MLFVTFLSLFFRFVFSECWFMTLGKDVDSACFERGLRCNFGNKAFLYECKKRRGCSNQVCRKPSWHVSVTLKRFWLSFPRSQQSFIHTFTSPWCNKGLDPISSIWVIIQTWLVSHRRIRRDRTFSDLLASFWSKVVSWTRTFELLIQGPVKHLHHDAKKWACDIMPIWQLN